MQEQTPTKEGQPCLYQRRHSISVQIGSTPIGAAYPIRLQSMANVSTLDTKASVEQAIRIIEAGADYVRFTAQGKREAKNLAEIRTLLSTQGFSTPLVADIHFNPNAADEALEHIEKVRINPGNYVDSKTNLPTEWTEEVFAEMHRKVEERFGLFVERAKTLGRAIRIGVNHGSLSERMVMLYGDTPQGMVESCLEYLDVCRQHDFHDIVISMKSSNTTVMTAAVRLLVQTLDERHYPAYPLHLGVTEAGEGEDGRIKSAVGIGSLLTDGIGDTIRVSLSEDPELEIPVGKALVDYITATRPLPIPADQLPSWSEYNLLRQGDRQKVSVVGKIVGGSNPAPVFFPSTDPKSQEGFEQRADFTLLPSGTLFHPSGVAILGVEIRDLHYSTIDQEAIEYLGAHPQTIVRLSTDAHSVVAGWRLGFFLLRRAGLTNPIILSHQYSTDDVELFRLQAATDVGTILLDGWGNGLALEAPHISPEELIRTEFGILQATRLRMTKTEFISCPGCGRTLYDLQDTIARIKAATSHLKGLKIGIMGCIVNGPGEMADADYGYVGSNPNKIDLYKGQECIIKGVNQTEAVEKLIELIKSHGDWQDPE